MKAVLLRTSSNNIHPPVCPAGSPAGSPKVSLHRSDSLTGMFAWDPNAHKKSIHLEVASSPRRRQGSPSSITRSMSESDMVRSEFGGGMKKKLPHSASRCSLSAVEAAAAGSRRKFTRKDVYGVGIAAAIPMEESVEDGNNNGGKNNGGGFGGRGEGNGGDNDNKRRMAEYYEQIIRSNPHDALLLRNYGKFLYEVEGDGKRAEEYYGRALLENPGDGEVLSLYANLIWENYKDQERAFTYFHQAASASPNDCMVLGSYAHFMWVSEDEEAEAAAANHNLSVTGEAPPPPAATTTARPAMVPAF
ncbi:unnamed protein product [Linum tenue]|uniref:Uncharacterized protein n=1 Tax=Linum tenue TaxID=586396 RepID=A0AAV0M3Y6_9ROSI|nr:unnamed protein product [Linum tenue]